MSVGKPVNEFDVDNEVLFFKQRFCFNELSSFEVNFAQNGDVSAEGLILKVDKIQIIFADVNVRSNSAETRPKRISSIDIFYPPVDDRSPIGFSKRVNRQGVYFVAIVLRYVVISACFCF